MMTFRRTRCPHCKGKLDAGQRIHPDCIDGYADAQAAKADRTRAKAERMAVKVEKAETRQRKEAAKRIPDLIKEAQDAFNAFIRERDRQAGQPLAVATSSVTPEELKEVVESVQAKF